VHNGFPVKTFLRPWPAGFRARPTLTLCVNYCEETFVPSCGRRGSLALREALERELQAQPLALEFRTIAVGDGLPRDRSSSSN
jgi:hypothetical protein